ncbi:cation channel sperm-associated protein 2-like [Pantherophis guttatus]|uniref:Cation channel sperm-associated protein 2-like n=1 Tax=Pantherophis guttatus TaxID=94885 RepID=A0ABM3ZIY9_PANGU|nr:cation channel sperm-associated protein 2-like [Pantherophis guttatus]
MLPFAPPKKTPKLDLNPRADAIRSKLIYTFYLIDHFEGLSHAVPRYNIQDFLDSKKRKKLMLMDHHQLVRFHVVPTRNIMVTQEKRWRNRIEVRCSRWPPFKMWVSSVLNSQTFKGFIIFLIFLNMVVLMISTEIMGKRGITYVKITRVLEVIIWIILQIFVTEIGLHWFVSFQRYWKNPWNIFDFIVTIISIIPEVIYPFKKYQSVTTHRLLLLSRVLRCLKLFPRVRQVRVLIMAIAKALKAMALILVLLAFLFYVFALSGIYFFESYTQSSRMDLTYNMYFMDMPNALVTIFILFTMDHWYALLQDSWKVPEINKMISGIFICLWLLIGAFIFRNLFVAIMVTNFQNIRSDLSEEVRQIETQTQADKFKMEIMEKRFSQIQTSMDKDITFRERFTMDPALIQTADNPDFTSDEMSPGILDWETYIHKNLPGLYAADEDEQVLWPRDSLFHYFELLEKLQYNLEERKELQQYMVLALSNLEDK